MLFRPIASVIATSAAVAAHGYVNQITVGSQNFGGFNPTVAPWAPDQGTISWPSWNTDTGPVFGNQVGHPDIVCQINATNAKISATVAAGSDVVVSWTTWPESHHGPILDYLADCKGDCSRADKTKLEWVKVQQMGQVRYGAGGGKPGYWAADVLQNDNGGKWTVRIPASFKAGNYVLRHEILALHSAYNLGGAQFYPQCINLRITGNGTKSPAGVVGQQLYKADDPGVKYNIWNDESRPVYQIPGPSLYQG